MGLGKIVNVVNQGLTAEQKKKLAEILEERKTQLKKAMDDVDEAMENLKK